MALEIWKIAAGAAALSCCAIAAGVHAQAFPSRPMRILTTESGAASDVTARLIAQGLVPRLGQQVIVENRGGVMAIEALMRALPDGHTILYYGASLWLAPLMQKTTYDPIKDVSPVSMGTSFPAVLAVHPSTQVKSVKELISLAKAKPGALNYGSSAAGSVSHLGAEQLKSLAGVDIVRVGFKGTGPAVTSLISGEVQVLFAAPATLMPHVKSGKIWALAVTSAKPSQLAPGLPTLNSFLPGYELTQLQGIFAPAKTLPNLVRRLSQEINSVLNQAEVKEKFLAMGIEATPTTPEECARIIKEDMARVGKIVKEAGIRIN